MPSPSPIAQELARAFVQAGQSRSEVSEKEAVKVSGAVSSVAFFYEKIRNVIDYKEDHLFCQSAIERNLQRQGFPRRIRKNLSESIVKDLIRSGYLVKNTVSQARINEVNVVLEKYARLDQSLVKDRAIDQNTRSWFLNVASAEIEKLMAPDLEDEAIASAFYRLLLPNINGEKTPDQTRNILAYLAAKRTLLKSSRATLRYSLLIGFHPEWAVLKGNDVAELALKLPETVTAIEDYLHSPHLDKLHLFFRRFTAPFLILNDVLVEAEEGASELVDNRELLEKAIKGACQNRYRKIRSKLTRAATRSIIYIFLTKMIFALFLELPFDLFVSNEVRALPLIINSLFPPFLMFAFVLSIPKPGEKNTQRILKDVVEIVYSGTFKTPGFSLGDRTDKRQSLRERIFRTFYFLTFFLTFGFIIWLLTLLNFNLLSVMIFLFFITVVSFFAYRVSQSAREIVIEEKETTLSALVDFFMIPILRTGRQLSVQLSKINVFNFLLDFVIEAPLKNILEIAEDWLGFIKEKKEEVV